MQSLRASSIHFAPLLLPFLFCMAAFSQSMPATTQALLPAPDALAQDRSRLMIYNIFKDDFAKTASADRDALAKRLMTEAAATKDDGVARYVLLNEALDLAAVAGDPVTAYKCATEVSKLYSIDTLELKKRALFQSNFATHTPVDSETLSRLALDLAEEAALADSFDSVGQLVSLAEGAADKTHKVSFVASIQTRLADARGLVRDYPKVQKALEAVKSNPDDADANLMIGQFYALRVGAWAMGLPHLAAGSDERLRNLAQLDLANPTEGLKQAELGDAWWGFSENSAGRTKTLTQQRATEWYQLAKRNLTGITLARIESRLHGGTPENPSTPSNASNSITPSANGPVVDLLAQIDPAKDSSDGKWAMANGALQNTGGKSTSCLALPYLPPEEYDLRVAFERTEGETPITFLLTGHGKAFGFALDVKGEARFERVGGKIAKDNPTTAPVVISNNHRYVVTIQIRKDSITALLDDKPVTTWKTDFKDLSRYAIWKMPDEKLCGLGVNNAKVTFYAVQFIEVSGKGRATR